jgi:hypothetical protein
MVIVTSTNNLTERLLLRAQPIGQEKKNHDLYSESALSAKQLLLCCTNYVFCGNQQEVQTAIWNLAHLSKKYKYICIEFGRRTVKGLQILKVSITVLFVSELSFFFLTIVAISKNMTTWRIIL